MGEYSHSYRVRCPTMTASRRQFNLRPHANELSASRSFGAKRFMLVSRVEDLGRLVAVFYARAKHKLTTQVELTKSAEPIGRLLCKSARGGKIERQSGKEATWAVQSSFGHWLGKDKTWSERWSGKINLPEWRHWFAEICSSQRVALATKLKNSLAGMG